MKEISEQLKEIKIEDYIWIILIFVSIFAIVSDYFEKEWLIKKNEKDYNNYKSINITLLIITFLVYFYFVLLSYKKYKQSLGSNSLKEIFFNQINLFAASLFLIAGLLSIFVEINSNKANNDIFL